MVPTQMTWSSYLHRGTYRRGVEDQAVNRAEFMGPPTRGYNIIDSFAAAVATSGDVIVRSFMAR